MIIAIRVTAYVSVAKGPARDGGFNFQQFCRIDFFHLTFLFEIERVYPTPEQLIISTAIKKRTTESNHPLRINPLDDAFRARAA